MEGDDDDERRARPYPAAAWRVRMGTMRSMGSVGSKHAGSACDAGGRARAFGAASAYGNLLVCVCQAQRTIKAHVATRFQELKRAFRMIDEDHSGKVRLITSRLAIVGWCATFLSCLPRCPARLASRLEV